MAVTTWLIDKSAYTRIPASPDAKLWIDRIERGLVRMSTVTRLEIGYSFRTAAHARLEAASPPLSLMPVEYLTPAAEDRAVELQLLLADRGQHRAPSIPDLLVAAAAEIGALTVLAVDKDFDLIAQISGQAIEWLQLT
ncbi:PIN domain nuclease [Mycobacterium gastri]|uniref:Ribonuclease VapC n=1 Tax=Mycobacterium gastri TaxID=1777 RepID=A0A1X1VSS5_MYCGS|nr:PIN domain nuclease [Mycobacterium gastri]ETW24921.1 ribonuclease [Mycobacterium gastri 'Wayne']ORV72130.1 ribonuclease [Mycobacterium gastri]